MKIIKIIRDSFPTLSNKQKMIATYLLRNRNRIAFLSLKELSSELGVTEVTILNFCKAINIESFTDLKKCFEDLIKEELKVPAKMKSSLEEIESLDDAVKNVIQFHKINLNKIAENNSMDKLDKSSKLIQNARTVYLCGLGISKLICDFLVPRFKKLNIDTKILNLEDLDVFSSDLARACDEDLFILISFPIYSQKLLQLQNYLSMKSFKFIAITDSTESPISENAEIVLLAENYSLVFYNFISAAIMLVELLLIVLSYNMKDKIIVDIKEVEKVHKFFINN